MTSKPHTINPDQRSQAQADLELIREFTWNPDYLEYLLLEARLSWDILYWTTRLGAFARLQWKLDAGKAGSLHCTPERLFNDQLRGFIAQLDDEDYDALDPSIQGIAHRAGRDPSDPRECWQPIDSPPPDDSPVLIVHRDGAQRVAFNRVSEDQWYEISGATRPLATPLCPLPTHWRALPKPPRKRP
jgi:hypothetical protein